MFKRELFIIVFVFTSSLVFTQNDSAITIIGGKLRSNFNYTDATGQKLKNLETVTKNCFGLNYSLIRNKSIYRS